MKDIKVIFYLAEKARKAESFEHSDRIIESCITYISSLILIDEMVEYATIENIVEHCLTGK